MNLIKCTHCNLNSCFPLVDQCHETPDNRWFIVTRCIGCFDRREVYVSQKTADQFDTALDKEARQVLAIIRKRERQEFEAFAKRFTAALKADALQPMDF